jgi:hypothetical protein
MCASCSAATIAQTVVEGVQATNERQETVVAAMSIQLELQLFPSDSVLCDDQYLNKITLHSTTGTSTALT